MIATNEYGMITNYKNICETGASRASFPFTHTREHPPVGAIHA